MEIFYKNCFFAELNSSYAVHFPICALEIPNQLILILPIEFELKTLLKNRVMVYSFLETIVFFKSLVEEFSSI